MTQELIERSRQRHAFADIPLVILTAALVLSLAIALTTVSIGIARADTIVPFGGGNSGRLTMAILLAMLVVGTGGLTAVLVRNDKASPRD